MFRIRNFAFFFFYMTAFGQVDRRLEQKLMALYKSHKERSAKIDWSYHEFLPLVRQAGYRHIDKHEHDGIKREDLFDEHILQIDPTLQRRLTPELYLAVETAVLTEVNLPWFTTELATTFRGSLQVLVDFTHTWTAEEDQHGDLLETYLLLTDNGDPWKRKKLRKQVIEGGFHTGLQSPLETMVYTSIQERATMVFYLNLAQACEHLDPGLARVLRRLARDETLHYTFYRDATQAHLEMNPNLVELVTGVMLKFEMPGAGMPDYARRMEVISKHAHYGPSEFYTQVIDELMKFWDIRNLQPTYAGAREAQTKAIAHTERLAKIAQRQMRERKRMTAPTLDEVMDEANWQTHRNKNGGPVLQAGENGSVEERK
jgi:acyl-[acyl-carrier-protein] desaturase